VPLKNGLLRWLTPQRTKPALITGLVLFAFSYVMNFLLFRLGIAGAATILDDLAIAILGALLLVSYLSAIRIEQVYLRAKERMNLTAELNHHVRNALTVIRFSAELDDRNKRLEGVDEGIDRIDRVLSDLVPTVNGEKKPRFSLPAQK
jgi:signal transduction histidine kinase